MPRTTRVTGITILFAMVACGPRSTPRDPTPVIVDAGVVEPPPVDAPPAVTLVKPTQHKPRIETPHGGGITDLAVTSDATAAVTSDDLGGHRLWPALDGTHEPRVIELPEPEVLALGHDPKGFLIAMIDGAGGLVLQQIDRDGAMLQRASLPIEPAYRGVAFTSRGPIAWRSDHRIVRVTADGGITAQLATEQGHRVLNIAVPPSPKVDRALAVIEGSLDTTTWRRARWLELGDKLAWGAWIDAGDAVEANVAVSPDLERFAYLSLQANNVMKLTVASTSDGQVLYAENAFNALSLVMPDKDHVVYSAMGGQTLWLDIAAKKPRSHPLSQPTHGGVLVAAAGKSFSPNGGEIMIGDATAPQYLGYALQASQLSAAGDRGQLAITWGNRSALLDDKLQARPLLLFDAKHTVNAMRHLAGTQWVAQALSHDRGTTVLSLIDFDGRGRTDLRTNQPIGQLSYEPATQLLGASFGNQSAVYRHAAKRLDLVASYPKTPPYERVQLWPVSPQLAGGTQLVTAHAKDATTLRWVADARALDKGVSMTIDGGVAAVDATGKVYAWAARSSGGPMELALLRDAKRIGTLAIEPGSRGVWPDAKGDRVMVSHTAGLTIYDASGKPLWTRPITGITHAVWLDDGAIAAVTGVGIVRLDGATGEPQITRCGWLFELASAPHPARSRVEPLCTKR